MPKHNQKGRSTTDAQHIRLYAWFTKTEAWCSLKPGPRALYVELAGLFKGTNNGDLFLSELEAAKRLNIDKKTARSYFRDLMDKGFIRVATKGSFNQKRCPATSWILTEHSFRNQLATKDFISWRALPEENHASNKYLQ